MLSFIIFVYMDRDLKIQKIKDKINLLQSEIKSLLDESLEIEAREQPTMQEIYNGIDKYINIPQNQLIEDVLRVRVKKKYYLDDKQLGVVKDYIKDVYGLPAKFLPQQTNRTSNDS